MYVPMSDTALFRTEAEMASAISARSGNPSVDTSLGTISLRVINDLQPLQSVWEDLQAHSPCTAAQTFDWAKAWTLRVLVPAGARPVIAVGYGADGKALFLWPFETGKVAGLSVLKWLGQDHANYCMGLFQPGIAQRINRSDLSSILREVGREAGVAAAALKKQPFGWDGLPNPFAQLPYQPAADSGYAASLGDFETIYMTRLTGHARGGLARTERRIAEHGPLSYGWAESREDRLALLDTLFAQKSRQFAEMGIEDKFTPDVRAFYRDIALLEGDNPSRLKLGYFKVGDTVLATHSGMICHNRLMITLSSRTEGELRRYSPGTLLLRHQIKEAAGNGLAFYDIGVGAASYKDKLCDVVEPLFDSFVAFKPQAGLLTLALASKARVKRFVKSNPQVYELAKKVRRALNGRETTNAD
jgi:CelD/BcsL family acetyltransferase involved in cellulose biosynthesis